MPEQDSSFEKLGVWLETRGFELVERMDSAAEKDVTDGVVREGQPRHRTGDCVSVQLWCQATA